MLLTASSDKIESSSVESSITYVWLTGHIRNVGDSALRRPYVGTIKSASEVNVWGGARPESDHYLAGLNLAESEVSPSFFIWYRRFISDLFTRKVNFAFNAGEFNVTKMYFLGMVSLLPFLLVLKMRGGSILWVGAGVPKVKVGFTWPFRILAKLSDLTRWRDSESSSVFVKAETMPDWAFALGNSDNEVVVSDGLAKRNDLLISLRGDRPYPSEAWLQSLEDLASRLGLDIVITVQVKDDQRYGERLAERLNAQLVGWAHESHEEQEKIVRDAYRKARVIFSDRLHGLIMASTEGAIPLGWCESSTLKISRHFNIVDAPWVGADNRDLIKPIAALTSAQFDDWHEKTAFFVKEAKKQLNLVEEEIKSIL